MGRRNPSQSQGARVSAWNLPKRLVPRGSLVFHFVCSQNAALSLLSLVAVERNQIIECPSQKGPPVLSPDPHPLDEGTEVRSSDLTCPRGNLP